MVTHIRSRLSEFRVTIVYNVDLGKRIQRLRKNAVMIIMYAIDIENIDFYNIF